MPTTDDLRRYRRNWQDEIDSAAQYRAMADAERTASVAQVYRELAAVEERHARFWQERLRKAGVALPPARPSWRARILVLLARRFGAASVLPTVAAREEADRDAYVSQPETATTRMTAQERSHARVLGALLTRSRGRGVEGSVIARLEGRHRTASSNALRAAVLGANDGLCSNLSLVMGVAGATASSRLLLVTGLAGLLAGACSMALGEWVSMKSSREFAERELGTEAEEISLAPEDEREELQLIYEAKGVAKRQAKELSEQLIAEPKQALDVLAREELGLDPEELGGSPLVAAATSFALFAVGALVPVLPFLALAGNAGVVASIAASGLALAVIGAAITIFTGKPAWLSALRQLVLGFAAAGVTYGVGKLLGVAVAG
ncbi:MAG: VIT1/CCC1 transporter family protein [Minicystis sp.]